MDKKIISIVSYITIIGWLVAFIKYRDLPKADQEIPVFHLKQSFGLIALSILMGAVFFFSAKIIPFFGILSGVLGLGFLLLMIIGILNSIQLTRKPLPFVGPFFESQFPFIK